jgi:acyl-ACP thioesterase
MYLALAPRSNASECAEEPNNINVERIATAESRNFFCEKRFILAL